MFICFIFASCSASVPLLFFFLLTPNSLFQQNDRIGGEFTKDSAFNINFTSMTHHHSWNHPAECVCVSMHVCVCVCVYLF